MLSNDERRVNSPQSVTRVFHILEALCTSSRPLSLAELSRQLNTPKSSMAALLRGLALSDFVVAAEGCYRLGPGAFGLGSALLEARRQMQSSDLIRAGMKRLAERTGETALWAVQDHPEAMTLTYVDVIESRSAVRVAVAVGDRRPLYCTSGGRMLLAAGSDEALQHYLKQLKPELLTEHTEINKRRLREAILTAREEQVAQTVDQSTAGLTGTAATIQDAAGTVLGALVVAAPTLRLENQAPELKRLVGEEAAEISRSLGYRGSPPPPSRETPA